MEVLCVKFFLLNILCLHWTFLYVDFLLHFFFISHAVQLLDARRTKVCPLFAACLFYSAQPARLVCLNVLVCVSIYSLLLAEAVILFTKPVHSFIYKKINKVLVCVCL